MKKFNACTEYFHHSPEKFCSFVVICISYILLYDRNRHWKEQKYEQDTFIRIIMSTPVIEDIRREMRAGADEKTRKSGERFFKEDIRIYGLKNADARKIGQTYYNLVKERQKSEIFNLCEQLWQSGYQEESIVACDWSYKLHKSFVPADIELFENWVDLYVTNWASCDTLCNHTVGEFIEMFPAYISRLKSWAKSENLWMRRASAVTFIVPARKGKFLDEILDIADILLADKEDMVQKGYGWMLKATSQAYQDKIFDYVMSKRSVMPRTALRYAIEKMPPEMKKQAMAKPY